jgi:hypothetical protein
MAFNEEYDDLDETLEDEDRGNDLTGEDDEEAEDEDSDDTEESEEEGDDEEVEEEEEPAKPSPARIPKARLDEVIRQREEAKERNLWLEEQLEKLINQKSSTQEAAKPAKLTYDYATAEGKYIDLIIEGQTKEAAALRSEIDRFRRDEMMELISEVKNTSSAQAKTESAQALDQDRFNTLIENMESKYKFLDSSHKSYNEEAVDTINTLLAGYIAAGKTKSEGLRLAVNKVAPLYEKEVTPVKQTLGKKRIEESGKKAVVAAKSQPPKSKSSSVKSIDLDAININKLSDKDFKSLTEKERRTLRGD